MPPTVRTYANPCPNPQNAGMMEGIVGSRRGCTRRTNGRHNGIRHSSFKITSTFVNRCSLFGVQNTSAFVNRRSLFGVQNTSAFVNRYSLFGVQNTSMFKGIPPTQPHISRLDGSADFLLSKFLSLLCYQPISRLSIISLSSLGFRSAFSPLS